MKNNILIEHLANADLSFLKVVKDEVIEVKNQIDLAVFERIKNPVCKENWSKDIELLETFFKELAIEKQLIQLNAYSKIIDVPTFIKNHLETVKANNGNKTFLPYLNRLQELKLVLTLSKVD